MLYAHEKCKFLAGDDLTQNTKRAIEIDSGLALVVTDLHGYRPVYEHIRHFFMREHAAGRIERLILCGDLIHHYGAESEDSSLWILLDVMRLQQELGSDTVIMLLGNHEMPHIYSTTLSKGPIEFTSRFEWALSEIDQESGGAYRRQIMVFLQNLPFFVFTRAGVMITHAGASAALQNAEAADLFLNFDHSAILRLWDDRLRQSYPLFVLQQNEHYVAQAKHFLGVKGTGDSRLSHLLRGQLLSQNDEHFQMLWDLLFTMNERGELRRTYSQVADTFLRAVSSVSTYPQRVLVSGHLPAEDGWALVTEKQLRVASLAHALPPDQGKVLLLDCERPVATATDLLPQLRHTLA